MGYLNVQKIGYFRKVNDGTASLQQFQDIYGFEPDGVNAYYGLNPINVDFWKVEGRALQDKHRAVLDDVRNTLLQGNRQNTKTIDLLLEPPHPFHFLSCDNLTAYFDPFGYVSSNLQLVDQLADELHAYQAEIQKAGKTLEIVVRYASEMNDVGEQDCIKCQDKNICINRWGDISKRRHIAEFKNTYRLIRQRFKNRAPHVWFTFSPALRRDLLDNYSTIQKYWPGDEYVDRVSCTWYVGRQGDLSGATQILRRYFLHHLKKHLPFGIDEIGGVEHDQDVVSSDGGALMSPANDVMLKKMLQHMALLEKNGVTFEYANCFLESKWGIDATLKFLSAKPD